MHTYIYMAYLNRDDLMVRSALAAPRETLHGVPQVAAGDAVWYESETLNNRRICQFYVSLPSVTVAIP